MALADVDLCDLDLFADGFPHQHFTRLRAEAPIVWNPESDGPGFFAITRHAHAVRISRDPHSFSSHSGTNIRDHAPDDLVHIQAQLVNMDPPQHVKYRQLVRRGFTPRQIAALEPHVRELTRKIVDRIAHKGECDFVTDVAAELPLQVILEMMGVPVEDRHLIFDLSNRLIGFDDPEFQTSIEDGRRAAAEMWGYAHQMAQERRAKPCEDLVTSLLDGQVDGQRLTDVEFNNFFLLLAVAGNETTRNAISGGVLALIEHPSERARLLAEPGLIPKAVEEILRWVTPVIHFRRTATRDVDLDGQPVRAGQKLVMFYPSANRDEAVFQDPFRFDVGRRRNPHLAFGIGEHFCLGAHLARLEIRVMLEELLQRLPDMELAAAPRRLRSNFINGIKEMRVRFTPEAG